MKNLQITAYMQHFIRQQVMPGDICIDATMGNGNDTALLSQLAGKRDGFWLLTFRSRHWNIRRSD